jgi:hypothetical protein
MKLIGKSGKNFIAHLTEEEFKIIIGEKIANNFKGDIRSYDNFIDHLIGDNVEIKISNSYVKIKQMRAVAIELKGYAPVRKKLEQMLESLTEIETLFIETEKETIKFME